MINEPQPDTVASLMIPLARYPHMRADASLREAFLRVHLGMTNHEHNGYRRALVLGEDNVLVGIINITALLLGLEPAILRTDPGDLYTGYTSQPGHESGMATQVFWERIFTQGFGQEPERPVGEVAQPVPVTLGPDSKLARALDLMLTEKQPVLPVVEDNGVLGVVRMLDIFERVVVALEKTGTP